MAKTILGKPGKHPAAAGHFLAFLAVALVGCKTRPADDHASSQVDTSSAVSSAFTVPLPARREVTTKCKPIGELGDVEALGLGADDTCFYDVTVDQLFDAKSCRFGSALGSESFGPFWERLVRLSEIELTVIGDVDQCAGTRCGPVGCGGKWQVGVRAGHILLELMTVASGEDHSRCHPECRDRTSNPLPNQARRVPVVAEVYPACPAWVWEKVTLLVRPTEKGLEVVMPPEGSKLQDWR